MAVITSVDLDKILALQLLVAWAGEAHCEPKRLGWWDTDLVDEAGGGDLLSRLAPRTHAWASLELVREAARRVDARARLRHGDPDRFRSLFFLGFSLDEKLADRLDALKRGGNAPHQALPLPFELGSDFSSDRLTLVLQSPDKVSFEKIPPVGRKLRETIPASPLMVVQRLCAALLPFADEYPLPFFKVGS